MKPTCICADTQTGTVKIIKEIKSNHTLVRTKTRILVTLFVYTSVMDLYHFLLGF